MEDLGSGPIENIGSKRATNNTSNNKNKRKFYKKNNTPFIINTILRVVEIGVLMGIWYELYLANVIVFD